LDTGMPRAARAKDREEQTCALRALNICDGTTVLDQSSGSLPFCYCASEALCAEVGWTGAAAGYSKSRSEAIAAAVLHPAGHLRRS